MKLLVHNMLTSKFLKGVSGTGYPLKIIADRVEKKESDFNDVFIKKHLERLDYPVLRDAALALGHGEGLPEELPNPDSAEDVLRRIHSVLLDVEVMEGALECPETGRKFPITNGIPNMLVNEDEVA